MANDRLNDFINNLGMTTEMWTIFYKSFRSQGLNDSEALKHTGALFRAIIDKMISSTNTEEGSD